MDHRRLIMYGSDLPWKVTSMCPDFSDSEKSELAKYLYDWQTQDKNRLNHFIHNYEVYSIVLGMLGFTAGIDEGYFNPYVLISFIALGLMMFLYGKNRVYSYSNSLEWFATGQIEKIRNNRQK